MLLKMKIKSLTKRRHMCCNSSIFFLYLYIFLGGKKKLMFRMLKHFFRKKNTYIERVMYFTITQTEFISKIKYCCRRK